jgi:hypothetical protein
MICVTRSCHWTPLAMPLTLESDVEAMFPPGA